MTHERAGIGHVPQRLEAFNLIVEAIQATQRPNAIGQGFSGNITWETGLFYGTPHQTVALRGLQLGSLKPRGGMDDPELGSFDRLGKNDGRPVFWPHRIDEIQVVSLGEEGVRHMPAYYSDGTAGAKTRLGMGIRKYRTEGPCLDLEPTSRYYETLVNALTNVRKSQLAWLIGTEIVGRSDNLSLFNR